MTSSAEQSRNLLPAGQPVAAVETPGVTQHAARGTSVMLHGTESLDEVPLDVLGTRIRQIRSELGRASAAVVKFAVDAGHLLCAAKAPCRPAPGRSGLRLTATSLSEHHKII